MYYGAQRGGGHGNLPSPGASNAAAVGANIASVIFVFAALHVMYLNTRILPSRSAAPVAPPGARAAWRVLGSSWCCGDPVAVLNISGQHTRARARRCRPPGELGVHSSSTAGIDPSTRPAVRNRKGRAGRSESGSRQRRTRRSSTGRRASALACSICFPLSSAAGPFRPWFAPHHTVGTHTVPSSGCRFSAPRRRR